jgi:superfamily II DNA or RNA helicase
MPKYRFRWDAFDDDTVMELATAYGFSLAATAADSRSWLAENVKRPNEQFVRSTFDCLLTTKWFCNFRGLDQIVEQLKDFHIGAMRSANSQKEYIDYIRDCRNAKTLRHMLCEAMIRFGDAGSDASDAVGLGWVRKFVVLIPEKQLKDPREPHPYQRQAWDRLTAKLAEFQTTRVFRGLLVMPTGSGKTFTLVRWLVECVISKGGRVLWVAHRYELLEQAAEAFDRAIYLAEPNDRPVRRRIVSGRHCSSSEICPDDDILICSVASLARRPDIVDKVLSDHFLVIDEAHHAPAKSYRDLIQRVNSQASKRVLGLTATPTRTVESERPELSRLFGQEPLYEVRVRNLIDQQYLAMPVPIRVQTKTDVERGITPEDLEHMVQYRDLSEEWKDRIAKLESRNQTIVKHYVDNRETYKKTLIFAINVLHAYLLESAFKEKDVEVGCITSYRYIGDPDDAPEAADHKAILERFRDRDSGLDVLINVMILTEGVDVPGIQTVFLARPSQSEILLRQMIGRALRGPKAGGTSDAYLVSFEDHWERFRDFESPFERLPDIFPPEVSAPGERPKVAEALVKLGESLLYANIEAAVAELRRIGRSQPIDVFESVPHGWFVLERPTEPESEEQQDSARERIPVYAHQQPCWDALIDYLESLDDDWLTDSSAPALFSEYFGDCDPPKPSDHNVLQLLEHYRAGGEKPSYHPIADRTRFDPYEIAQQVHEDKADKFALIEESYSSSLIQAIYPSRREYVAAVDQALYDLQYPKDAAARLRPGIPIFEPRPDQQLSPGPAHDLEVLMTGVLEEGKALLNVPDLPFAGRVEWTARIIKGWYGMANWEKHASSGTGTIRINRLLNSPDMSPATMRFLLWHEYLHLYLQQLHTHTFRELEAKWPGRIEADRQLDTLNERFGIAYW